MGGLTAKIVNAGEDASRLPDNDKLKMTIRLSNIDIRQLRIFRAVVECNSFANAEAELNVSQSTISHQMSNLEARLGINLCERGRSGFRLTDKGKRVYEETLLLFRAHERFQYSTGELKGKLSGYLNIVLIDNVITDPKCPIVTALNKFNERIHDVMISLDTMLPGDIERSLLDMDMDIAIGTFERKLPGLSYKKIYVEINNLMCGAAHPIAKLRDPAEVRNTIRSSRKVTRSYLNNRDISMLDHDPDIRSGVAQSLEAQAIFILGGSHIGFLPVHYTTDWVKRKQMQAIFPNEITYKSPFYVVTKKSPRKSKVVETFTSDLTAAISECAGKMSF